MAKRMLIDAMHPEETRVVIADDNQIIDFDFVSSSKKQLKGNIYLAKITRVEPSLQAAFVEYGGNKQGFLPFSEIHPDYYQIPVSDRKRLMEEAESQQDSPQDESSASDGPPSDADAMSTESQDSNFTSSQEFPLAPAIDEMPETGASEEPAFTEAPTSYAAQSSEQQMTGMDFPLPEEISSNEPAGDEAQDMQQQADTEEGGSQEQAGESVETLQNEEEEIQQRPKKFFSRRYKIQEVIRRGQIVLVQVIKEERGNKGASLTTYLSLAGRYCVLMPNSPKDGGISRKIASSDDRKRLKAISTELRLAAGMSVIIRTAGTDRTRAEIKRDYDYLVKVWNRVREETLKSNAPALIYEESDVIKRAIRDQYTNDMDEVIIQGEEGYETAKDFMKLLLQSHTPKVKLYDEPVPLFYAHNIEDQLLSMHDPVVKLRSGGYIVINPTEALISIDVNSGRATGERNIEETAYKTNIEAAVEVARQLRLRDLAGLIVIDFIDMLESRNRRAVEKAIKDALKLDRAKIQLGRISPFGLLEMSRQRLRPSISETNMVQCPHCIGRGYIRSNESMSIQLIRSLEKEAASGTWSSLRLIAPQNTALHLLNTKREALRAIEDRHNVTIQVLIDSELAESDFNLEKMRRSQSERSGGNDNNRKRNQDRNNSQERNRPAISESVLEEMNSETPLSEENESDNEPFFESVQSDAPREDRPPRDNNRRGGRSRRGRRGPRRDGQPRFQENAERTQENAPMEPASNDNITEVGGNDRPNAGQQRPRRERGGRGRKRWRDDRNRDNNRGSSETSSGANPSSDAPAPAPAATSAQALPAFTRQQPVLLDPPPPPFHDRRPEPAPKPVESTPRDPSRPSKKGWWQKMIELDN